MSETHGIMVMTQNGMLDISRSRSAQLVERVTITGKESGTATPPAAFNTGGWFAYAVANDGKTAPTIIVLGDDVIFASAFSRSELIEPSTNFTIMFVRMK